MPPATEDRQLTWREKHLVRRQSPLNQLIGFSLAFGAAGQYLWLMLKSGDAGVSWMIQMVILSIVLGMLAYGLWMWRFRLHHRVDMNLVMLALGGFGMMVGTVVDTQLGIGHGAHGHGAHGSHVGHTQPKVQPAHTGHDHHRHHGHEHTTHGESAESTETHHETEIDMSLFDEVIASTQPKSATTQPMHDSPGDDHNDHHEHDHSNHHQGHEHADHDHDHSHHGHDHSHHDHSHHDHHDHTGHEDHGDGHGSHQMGLADFFIAHSYSFHVWMMLVFSIPPTVLFTRCGVRASMNKGEWLTVHVIGNAAMIIGMIFMGWVASLFAHETGVWAKTISHSLMMLGMFIGMNLGMLAGFVIAPKAVREKLDQVGR